MGALLQKLYTSFKKQYKDIKKYIKKTFFKKNKNEKSSGKKTDDGEKKEKKKNKEGYTKGIIDSTINTTNHNDFEKSARDLEVELE